MKNILFTVLICGLICVHSAGQSGFTTNTKDGLQTITGNYWLITYNEQKALAPPTKVTNGRTETKQQVYVTDTEQKCYDFIFTKFGQMEVDRVKLMLKPPTRPDTLVYPDSLINKYRYLNNVLKKDTVLNK